MMPTDVQVALSTQFPSWLIRPSQAQQGQVGNLYVQDLPDDPDFAVAVYQYGGREAEETFGDPTYVERPRLQVLVRSADISEAFDRSEDIKNYLVSLKSVVLNGNSYLRFQSLAEPQELGPDSENRQRVVTNYQVFKG